MNRTEVKNKLRKVIIKMLSNYTAEEIPDAIASNILKYYGCTVTDNSFSKDDLDLFLKNLQKYIETTHCVSDDSTLMEPKLDMDFYENYLHVETEYCEVTQELTELLEKVVKSKESFSEYFKHECKHLNTDLEILNKKCQFLKLQCLLKLYGEQNSLKGHLSLRNQLREELMDVKEKYSKAMEDNKRVSEMKDFKKLSELFRVYKELKNTETAAKMLAEL